MSALAILRALSTRGRSCAAVALLFPLSACGSSPPQPADRMSADELTRTIERLSTPQPLAKPVAVNPQLRPLLASDIDATIRDAAICSFANAEGVLLLASRNEAIARVDQARVLLSSSAPVAPDGGYFTAGPVRISVGLAAGVTELDRIAAGRAEARLLLDPRPDQSAFGSWTCKPPAPSRPL